MADVKLQTHFGNGDELAPWTSHGQIDAEILGYISQRRHSMSAAEYTAYLARGSAIQWNQEVDFDFQLVQAGDYITAAVRAGRIVLH
ncbi:MAG: hypothetical protein ACR2QC_07845 [Gammaproteobacteria bacterium]